MHKIRKGPLIGIVMYTLFITIFITVSFYFFLQKSASISYTSSNTVYVEKILYPSDTAFTPQESNSTQPITSNALKAYFQSAFFRNLPFLISIIIMIVLCSSILLWVYIRHKEMLKTKEISNDLHSLVDVNYLTKDEELKKDYDQIHQYISKQQHDYGILQSYMMHEQKNLITLMQAKLSFVHETSLHKEIQSLSNSIDDILTLSSSQSPFEQLDIALLCASVIDQYTSIYPLLHFDFDEDKRYIIAGREHWLRRALDNLLNNAIKYGNQRDIEVFLNQEQNSIQLKVRDHGDGIAEKELDHICDFCYQIQELKKDGYGIGLSLVKHVADLCNGAIWVESMQQEGSTFILSFPLLKLN